jgi:hypothetical protein
VGEREKKTKEEEGGKRKKEYMTNIWFVHPDVTEHQNQLHM